MQSLGIEDGDARRCCRDQTELAQFGYDLGDGRTGGPYRFSQLLLCDGRDQASVLLPGGEVEKVVRDALPQRAEGTVGDSVDRVVQPARHLTREQPADRRLGLAEVPQQ